MVSFLTLNLSVVNMQPLIKGFNYIYEDKKQTIHKGRFSLPLLVLDRLGETNTREYTLKDVRTNFFCAPLLRTKFTRHSSCIERAH